LDPSLRGSDHFFRLVRAATVCGATGSFALPSARASCLKRSSSPVTAWAIEGDNQQQADFLASALASVGVPMWNFSFPYKLKQLIDLSC
jgi:malonate decarboxylase alpha subunit